MFVSFVGYLVDVVGTSAIVANEGRGPLLGLWTFDAMLFLVVAGAVMSFIDRVDRARFITRVLWVYVGVAIALAVLLRSFPQKAWLYVVASVIDRTMNFALYSAALTIVRDAFGQNPWALARVSAATAFAAAAGSSAAVAAGAMGIPPYQLFAGVALFCCLFALYFSLPVRASEGAGDVAITESAVPAPESTRPGAAFLSLRPSMPPAMPNENAGALGDLKGALLYLRKSREVWLVATLGVLNGIGHTVLGYEVARLLSSAASESVVQERYGSLRTLEFLANLGSEVLLAPLLLQRWGFARILGITPVILLGSMALLLGVPSLAIGMIASTTLQFAFGFEALALSTAIASAPEEKRGRVGQLLDGAPYQVGYLAAIAGLALLLVAESFLGLGVGVSRTTGLVAGLVSSGLAVFTSVLLMRKRRAVARSAMLDTVG